MKIGSLFSGIGGLDLGLERAGMDVIWQVENDPYCNKVLEKHWPGVKRYGDIKDVDWSRVEGADLICGGFPCVDISHAGRRAGLEGEHSGLWAHFHRAVSEIRPAFALVENTSSLLVRGIGKILSDLASIGYDAEWDCLPAAAFGAPHLRARIWILAYPGRGRYRPQKKAIFAGRALPEYDAWWSSEPDVGRVAHGVPARVDRLRGLGNAVVPQVAEYIGRRIMEAGS